MSRLSARCRIRAPAPSSGVRVAASGPHLGLGPRQGGRCGWHREKVKEAQGEGQGGGLG